MTEPDDRFRALLRKYLQSTCKAHELDELLRLLQNPACEAILNEHLQAEAAASATQDLKADPRLSRYLRQSLLTQLFEEKRERPRPIRLRSYARYAAAAALLIGSVLIYWLYTLPAMKVIKTTYRQKKELRLPDRSLVI
ncbi:MAG: hypothetical protein HC880_12345 [Bacteroidia bacterium]|nr:hypothetical protein [Bacteroidia bacterium]